LTALVSGPDPGQSSLAAPARTTNLPDQIPITRSSPLQDFQIGEAVSAILTSGVLSNGPYVRELEERAADHLGVAHCVAVSSYTTGLMLVLRAAELSCEVVVPGFCFGAVVQAAVWNGLQVAFADIDPQTLTLSPESATDAVGIRTSALLAVHTFGIPCDMDGLGELAERNGIALLFDAADAFGSRRRGNPLGGAGDAGVFNLSPRRVLTGCEGGLIATNDSELAERCRIGRDGGHPDDFDTRLVGLEARLSEIHAAVALASLESVEERAHRNNLLAATYGQLLDGIDGIDLPQLRNGDSGNDNGFTVLVHPERFGLAAAELARVLASQGVETRRYERLVVAPGRGNVRRVRALPVASMAASRALTLPLWPELTEAQISRVVELIASARTSRNGGGSAAVVSA
jgi:dTDP-4-amino-4,6-dideoxygalactose transaminase